MITNQGYNGDTLDHINSERLDTYRASGRWFHALWRWAIGTNPHTIAQGLTACLFFSLSLVIVTHVLQIQKNIHRIIFGLIYLILPQYAYVMDFIYQADTVAFGLTSVAMAAYFIKKKGGQNYFFSLIFLIIALAIYQSLILNYCTIIMVLVYNSTKYRGGGVFLIKKSTSCVLLALIIYYCLSKFIIYLIDTKPEVVTFLETYRASFNNTSKFIFNGDIYGFVKAGYLTVKHMIKTLIYPRTYAGEWIYITCYIPLILLIKNIAKQEITSLKKIALFFILIGIWIMPFFLIIAFLNPGAMASHNRLCEPLSLACLWMLSIQIIHWNKIKEVLLYIGLIFLTLKSSNYINEHANIRRYDFEAQLTAYKAMEFEAIKIASEANIPIKPENILLFNVNKAKHGSYDTFRAYPALTFINPTKSISNEEYTEILKEMQCFPEKNSIIPHNGKIIIKCDSSCWPKGSLINQ